MEALKIFLKNLPEIPVKPAVKSSITAAPPEIMNKL